MGYQTTSGRGSTMRLGLSSGDAVDTIDMCVGFDHLNMRHGNGWPANTIRNGMLWEDSDDG